MKSLLEVNPDVRLSAEQALGHPWFRENVATAELVVHESELSLAIAEEQEALKQIDDPLTPVIDN